jgi:hypothetical protein
MKIQTQKFFSMSVVLGSALLGMSAFADLPGLQPDLVTADVDHVFVPSGFDDNDNSQIVITGTLPSTCFKTGPAEYVVDKVTKTVTVKAQSYYYQSDWCLFVVVPYMQALDLGPIRAGGYKVMVENKTGNLGELSEFSVAQSTNPGPDDYLYAPVNEARVDALGEGKVSVQLVGAFPNTCLELDEVKVFQNTANVIEILPTAKMKRAGAIGCAAKMVPFSKTISIDSKWKGSSLIHVRSLNGQAINNVTTIL